MNNSTRFRGANFFFSVWRMKNLSALLLCIASLSACSTENSPTYAPDSDLIDVQDVDQSEQALGHAPPADPAQLVADLGTCQLESGETIKRCQIGYRTFGTLNASKSNVILWPTWFTGRTSDLVALGVPTKFVDTSRYFLVLVDALGDGISSGPSNAHPSQRRQRFPTFNIRDMVETQRRLLVERLGVTHLHGVGGISMGGMQAMQWSVTHPSMVDKVAAMVGSPQLTSQDLLLWRTMMNAITRDVAFRKGNYNGLPAIPAASDALQLVLFTPAYRAAATSRDEFLPFIEGAENSNTFDWNDETRQLTAMMQHDVAAPYGSLQAAAARVTAQSLYLVSAKDLVVYPKPAQDFGAMVGADVRTSDSDCGHLAVQACETDAAGATVKAFFND